MPALRLIATVIGLHSMNELLNVLGGIVKELAGLLLSEDRARLFGMLVLGDVDMLMGMKMLVLMIVVLVVVLDQVGILVIVVLMIDPQWDNKTNNSRCCAERNER